MTEDLLGEIAPAVDPAKDYLLELVGEGKKFKTPADLARGKYAADLHIATLEKRQDQLRADFTRLQEESQARAKLEELVEQLRVAPPPTSSTTPPAKVDDIKPGLAPEDIESLVDSKLEARELSKRQSDNFKIVQAKLKEHFGNDYQRVLKEQIEELKLPADYVNDLARRSPEAFFRTMGLNEVERKDNFQAPYRSNQRSDNFNQQGPAKRTWAHYQEMRKSNPKLYYDPKIAVQMEKDYQALGKAFEDGDFKQFGDGI